MPQNNALLKFSKEMTQYDPLLQERVEGLYHKFFEGTGTLTALDNLRSEVGDNKLETEGDGVFGLANAQGYNDGLTPKETIDDKINQGIENGNLGDFGTAIATEQPPTENDLGLGGFETQPAPPPDMTNGPVPPPVDEPFDDSMFGDNGSASDLGLDGLDDELPEDKPVNGGTVDPNAKTADQF